MRYKGKTIADVLQMDFAEAAEFFESQPRISDPLKLLAETGLGYLTLGQASNTLSRRGSPAAQAGDGAHQGAARQPERPDEGQGTAWRPVPH